MAGHTTLAVPARPGPPPRGGGAKAFFLAPIPPYKGPRAATTTTMAQQQPVPPAVARVAAVPSAVPHPDCAREQQAAGRPAAAPVQPQWADEAARRASMDSTLANPCTTSPSAQQQGKAVHPSSSTSRGAACDASPPKSPLAVVSEVGLSFSFERTGSFEFKPPVEGL